MSRVGAPSDVVSVSSLGAVEIIRRPGVGSCVGAGSLLVGSSLDAGAGSLDMGVVSSFDVGIGSS